MKIKLVGLLVIIGFLSSCKVLNEYEKVNINDPDMTLAERKSMKGVIKR